MTIVFMSICWTCLEIKFPRVHWDTVEVCTAAIFRAAFEWRQWVRCERFRGNEDCKMINRQKIKRHPQHKHPSTHTHTHTGIPSGVLSGNVQLPLRDVNSFGGQVSTGGYHGSQRGELYRRVEEAVLGEPAAFGGGHQRLDKRQRSVSL